MRHAGRSHREQCLRGGRAASRAVASRAATTRGAAWAVVLLLIALMGAGPAAAQPSGEKLPQFEGVGLTEKLGDTIPTDLAFRNAAGETVRLSRYFAGDKPVILQLAYFDCPMICPLMLDGLAQTFQGMDWKPGQEFEVVTLSFNPREGPDLARKKKMQYVSAPDSEGASAIEGAGDGWHFLTGDEASIKALTDAVGFNYRWVEEKQEYAHPTAIIFLSGSGKVTRYIYGMEVSPGDARKALVEASNGTVGTAIDRIALYCFQFDPEENSYVADAFNIMRLAGGLTVVLLGITLFIFWRRESRNLEDASGTTPA